MEGRVQSVALLGATSLVGDSLLPLLTREGRRVLAFSRQPHPNGDTGIDWRVIDPLCPTPRSQGERGVQCWICLTPISVLPDYFSLMEEYGVQRVVVLSSTSRFTKSNSSDIVDQGDAQRLIGGEARLQEWAKANRVAWSILRPTLIYGRGRDRNITEIARFVHRFGFFPLLGKARGVRQPIHADDVAAACLAALKSPAAASRAYNISGAETLSYREMVRRVFLAVHCKPRMVAVPLTAFRLALACLRLFPRYRQWSIGMAERMNLDQAFDHSDAVRDLGFSPRPFQLSPEDVSW